MIQTLAVFIAFIACLTVMRHKRNNRVKRLNLKRKHAAGNIFGCCGGVADPHWLDRRRNKV